MRKRFPEILPKWVPGVIEAEDPVPDRKGLVGLSVSYSHAHYKTPLRSRKSVFVRTRKSIFAGQHGTKISDDSHRASLNPSETVRFLNWRTLLLGPFFWFLPLTKTSSWGLFRQILGF
jgi:hypothetical protein